MNKNEINNTEKTKESNTNLSNLVDSGIGIDMSSPKNKNTNETTVFPFETPLNNHPRPTSPIQITSTPQTHQVPVIEEVISVVRTPSLNRDVSASHTHQPLITSSIDILSANKSVFHDFQNKDELMDFNNNYSNINNNKSSFSKAKRPILRKNKTEESVDIILESPTTTPPPKPPTRSKSSYFYTISPFSTRSKSTQSNPPLGTTSLSTSNQSTSPFTPSTTPPFWHSIFESHCRCSAEMVDIAIRGASQKHSIFTPPRIDSSLDLSVMSVEVDASIRRPRSIHNPHSGSRGLMNILGDVEKEVGAGLRLVSDIIHVKQTGLSHGYHLDEHPSLMYNRAYSRSFPGAPSLPGIKGDDDDILGCHGFKRKKDRDSKMA